MTDPILRLLLSASGKLGGIKAGKLEGYKAGKLENLSARRLEE
jgi:hypothetical protein